MEYDMMAGSDKISATNTMMYSWTLTIPTGFIAN